MLYRKIFCLYLASLFIPGLVIAQNKWTERAQTAFKEKNYRQAIEFYEWSLRKDSSLTALTGLGDCHRHLNDYAAAGKFYSLAVMKPGAPPESFFYNGLCLLNQKKYAEAQTWFRKYADKTQNDLSATGFDEIEAFVSRVMNDSSQTTLSLLPFNSGTTDFGAVSLKGKIYFASSRNKPAVLHTSTVDNAPLLDIFTTSRKDSLRWDKPQVLPGDINTKYNEGPLCFGAGGTVMYFTRNNFLEGSENPRIQGLNKLKIYQADWLNNQWTHVRELPFNSNDFATGHPAWDEKRGRLWFASDRPGGFGGTDIWFADLRNGSWTAPLNAGKDINTQGDEMFPTIGSDGLLYYSSDGKLGLGGLDLFMVKMTAGDKRSILNLGYPINSNSDDFGYWIDSSGKNGYLSSNRGKSPENDDIYSFTINTPGFDCFPQEENIYCFTFFNTDTLEFEFDTVPIIYEWDFGDGTKARGEIADHCFAGPGDYQVRLNLIDSINGYVFLNQVTYDFSISDIEQVFINVPDTVTPGTEIKMDAARSVIPYSRIENYYWDLGSGFRKGETQTSIRFEEPGVYTIRLGATASQEESGEKIRECVTKEIVVIPEERILYVRDSIRMVKRTTPAGHIEIPDSVRKKFQTAQGEIYDIADSADKVFKVQIKQSENPIDLNTPENRDLGPVKESKEGNVYNYTIGEEKSLDKIYPYYKKALDKGFREALVVAFKEGRVISGNDSTFYVRLPGEKDSVRIRLITGKVTDDRNQPLRATITWEDLAKGTIIDTAQSDSSGQFFIKLPDGRVYGYYAEMEGYYPSSNHLDLTKPIQSPVELITIEETLKLVPVEKMIASGIPLRLNNIFFDYDSDQLRKESYPELDRLYRLIKEHPELVVEIQGHTDDEGSDEYNLALSQRRANSVLRYLVISGLSLTQVGARGLGESAPAVPNSNAENRQFNRRVEFRLKLR